MVRFIVIPCALLTALFIVPAACYRMLVLIGRQEPNFEGHKIPVCFGISIFTSLGVLLICLTKVIPIPSVSSTVRFYSLSVGVFFGLGLLDDWIGDKSIKGLKGHFRAAVSGRITTGFVKAVGGLSCAIACGVHLYPHKLPSAAVAGFTIALMANLFNLLDLRPGRSAGVFLAAATAMLALMPSLPSLRPATACLAATVLACIPSYFLDSRAKVMMGDAGSNLLGAGLGISLMALHQGTLNLIVLLILIAAHIAAERKSFTAIIAESPLLTAIDNLTGARPNKKAMR